MKNLLLVLISFFIFIGCGPKEVVIPKDTGVKPKDPIVKPEPTVVEPEIEPIVVEPEPIIIEDDGLNRIAVIYPSKIVGKYAKSTLSTISAFLIYSDKKFEIETFDTYNEDVESILNQVNLLNEKGFTKVIAMFTQNGFETLNTIEETKQARFYFPLINKSEVYTENPNFIFGGISYSKQLDLLQNFSNDRNTMFYIKSFLGNKLREKYENSFMNPGIIKEIERKTNRFKHLMEDKRMIGNTIILNTPIVKSSIIMSQLTAYEVYPSKILSTQLNYNPLLVKLTQPRDRENFFVANSIDEVDGFIEDYSRLLGANITYNWVDYSSLVGVNYLLNDNESEYIRTQVIDNQVEYEPSLYQGTAYGFQKLLMN